MQRNQQVGKDSWNTPLPPELTPHLTDLACDFWVVQERSTQGPNVNVVVEDARMIIARDADVAPADVITEVRDRVGAVISPGTLEVLSNVSMHPTHRELALRLVAGTYTPQP